ncbi:MAG: DUF3592 domain-containing protein [Bacteroidota bacterium]|nr:DUF3592 domain-containing protein [Candidatus Kapabacteria bacterium]MDW8219138.1 DUF3592 domain-containing protein [Bacteroidota bacterium]
MLHFLRTISQSGRFILLISALAGLPLTATGILQLYSTYREMRDGMQTVGTVVRFQQSEGAVYPVVRFEAVGQGIMRFTDHAGSRTPEFYEGQQVPVLYQRYEPEKARIYTLQRLWLAPVLTTSVGIVPLVLGGIIVWLMERRNRVHRTRHL